MPRRQGIWTCVWTARDELVTGSNDESVAIWDPRTRLQKHVLRPAGGVFGFQSVVADATGATLATASIDNKVRLWDAEKGSLSGTIEAGGAVGSGIVNARTRAETKESRRRRGRDDVDFSWTGRGTAAGRDVDIRWTSRATQRERDRFSGQVARRKGKGIDSLDESRDAREADHGAAGAATQHTVDVRRR